jgi:hypothetical protein
VFFCEPATEMANLKLGTTPHINNRPPVICISALFLTCKPSDVFFKILCKLLPISLEAVRVCTSALIRQAHDFLQK